jgi:GWxTD domain-containing protein
MSLRSSIRLVPAALFLAGCAAFAQTIAPVEPIRLTADIARFRGADDQHVNLEIYYGFPQRSLTYVRDSLGFSGAGDVTLLIKQADSLLYADRWLVAQILGDTSGTQGSRTLVGIYPVQLLPGDYSLTFITRDKNASKRIDTLRVKLPVRLFSAEKTVLSDIEFASSIHQGEKGGTFYKNTLDVIPNVGGVYLGTQPCFYYAEAYNLLASDDRSDFFLRTNVFDAVGKEILSREKQRKRAGESSVLVDQFASSKLRTGSYTLVLSLLDSSRKTMATSARKFFIYNRELGIDSTLISTAAGLPLSEYMSMDEIELDREFKWSRWEAMDVEKEQFAPLKGVEAKRKFMSDFWRKRGMGRRDEYLSRVAYANSNFNVMGREGFRTDRGRVYVVYGAPDDVERHPNEVDSKPYEIWSFHNIQGGVIFVFVQRNQGGDYDLVHSTHRNELQDENWDRVGITR